MKYEFERKAWEFGFLSLRFQLNYWLLVRLGLVGFGIVAALVGALLTIGVYQWLIL